jgi:hypothetical protein
MYGIPTIIECLKARKTTIEQELNKRENNEQSFSDWKHYPTEQLSGRLSEINNTLDMMCK